MCRSAGSKRTHSPVIAVVISAVALCVGLMANQLVNLRARDVTARTVAAAIKPDPLAFAAALAFERVPAGFIITGENGRSDQAAANGQYSEAPVSLGRAVELFTKTHSAYTVVNQSPWALVVRPKERTLCDMPLRRWIRAPAISGSALEAFWRFSLLVSPETIPQVPPGLVCGGGDCSDRELSSRLRVTIPAGASTLQEGLSQIADQAGLVWVLQEVVSSVTGEHTCRFSYFDGDSRMETGYILAKSARR